MIETYYHMSTSQILPSTTCDIVDEQRGYNLSLMMEDWLHVKRVHRDALPQWASVHRHVFCPVDARYRCKFLPRYRRDRTRDQLSHDADIKSKITADKIDSIHCYLFHSADRAGRRHMHRVLVDSNKRIMFKHSLSDEKALVVDRPDDVWSNNPQCIEQCDVEQLQWLLQHHVFDEMPHEITTKLSEDKHEIIEFFEEHKIDGAALTTMGRKEFTKQLKNNIGNGKLMAPLAAMYSYLVKYNVSQFAGAVRGMVLLDFRVRFQL